MSGNSGIEIRLHGERGFFNVAGKSLARPDGSAAPAYLLVYGLSCGDSHAIRSYDLRARGKAYEIMDGSFGRFSVHVIAGRFRNGARW
jgi:hypothetical protein